MILYAENLKTPAKKLLELKNSVRLQDKKLIYRNLLHFYTVLTSIKKRNEENNPIYNCTTKNKIPRNKFNQGCERPAL